METRAVAKYIRISPQKTKLVVDLIRGRNAEYSAQILKGMNKKAAGVVNKVLHSAIANAREKELNLDRLWIKTATVNGGPVYKRYMSRAMGRATLIRRPTSHVMIVLSDDFKKKQDNEITKNKDKKKKESRLGKMRKKITGKQKTADKKKAKKKTRKKPEKKRKTKKNKQ